MGTADYVWYGTSCLSPPRYQTQQQWQYVTKLLACRSANVWYSDLVVCSFHAHAGTWPGHEVTVEAGCVVVKAADRVVKIPYSQAKSPAEVRRIGSS